MALDTTVDQVFQDWDDQKVKLRTADVGGDKLGPWGPLVNQRLKLFVERWRPDRMRLIKRLGGKNDATPETVRGHLTPLARDEFLSDLKTWGVPDKYANAALNMIEAK